jgi:YceI-like protein
MAARFDASSAECLVYTEKAGLLSGVAHDLKLRVEQFEILVETDRAGVQARFDASSLRVVCAVQGGRDQPQALSARDRREIEATILRDVLDARRHPLIEFRSTRIEPQPAGASVEGILSLHGRERPLLLQATREDGRARIEARLHQPDFGIRPYTAMLGALRIKADVTVRLVTPWPAS